MKKKKLILILLVGGLSLVVKTQAREDKGLGTFWVCWENDSLVNTDRGFTNGLKLTWISPFLENSSKKAWLNRMPFLFRPGRRHALSLSLRQDMFTPDDLKRADLNEEDRPYAGYLGFELGIYNLNHNRMSFLGIGLGIVGPLSLAEKTQKFVHTYDSADWPEGWHHQLKNELAAQLVYERKWRMAVFGEKKGLGLKFVPQAGGGLGNVYTYGHAGLQVHLGWNLPDDFGLPFLQPGGDSAGGFFERDPARSGQEYDGIYLFTALDGQVVLRNIFLDGNTFRESHRVEKESLTAYLLVGLGAKVSNFNLSMACVAWTRLFKTQVNRQIYVITSISHSF